MTRTGQTRFRRPRSRWSRVAAAPPDHDPSDQEPASAVPVPAPYGSAVPLDQELSDHDPAPELALVPPGHELVLVPGA
jgi:hypothetical protein